MTSSKASDWVVSDASDAQMDIASGRAEWARTGMRGDVSVTTSAGRPVVVTETALLARSRVR
jgi:hypothetical protein